MSERAPESERNKAVVRRFIEEVQNQKDWEVFDELNAPDFVNLSGHAHREFNGIPPTGKGVEIQYVEPAPARWPDHRALAEPRSAGLHATARRHLEITPRMSAETGSGGWVRTRRAEPHRVRGSR